ncbi:MAG: DUF6050 family protein [Sphaerochaeta sp.]
MPSISLQAGTIGFVVLLWELFVAVWYIPLAICRLIAVGK